MMKHDGERHVRVPLQDQGLEPLPGQHSSGPLVQYTTVTMVAEPPKDHVIWSLCCFVYCCNPCCLGLLAFIFSIKARDRKVLGDLQGARQHGSSACCLNVVSTVLVCLMLVLLIVMWVNGYWAMSRLHWEH
ncbi:dispanin subfamily A member 2b-like [Nelusetta ayraudi]|uniref:dispanin subfamily A member 2b-like n=1 Tax=Nelusetta ayraudi TaxID=303726 RepID=UPI003F6E9900